jgi:uncharacterized protein YdhG (YjbR/CyaY superfamily)
MNYLEGLPPDRKETVAALRQLILETIPDVRESFRYKMPTYDAAGDFLAAVASQKNYLSLYMNTEVIAAHRQDLAHLNCGKSCIRFKKLEDLPLETVVAILEETYAKHQKE